MKQGLFRTAAAMAFLASAQAQAAQPKASAVPPPRPCITDAEVHGLVAYFLPNVLQEVSSKCRALLPPSSYLQTGLRDLAVRLEAGRAAAWPQAKAGFFKFAPSDKDGSIAALSDQALRGVVDQVILEKLSIPMNATMCGEANDIAQALAPLNAEQSVHLIATIFNAVGRNDKSMHTCPRQG